MIYYPRKRFYKYGFRALRIYRCGDAYGDKDGNYTYSAVELCLQIGYWVIILWNIEKKILT